MKRILIVEDQKYNMRLIEQIIEDMDHPVEILKAASGSEAVSTAAERHIDLVLMDIALPDQDGVSVTAALRAFPHMREIPFIAVTAYGTNQEREIFDRVFQAVVSKPIDEEILCRSIYRLLWKENNESPDSAC